MPNKTFIVEKTKKEQALGWPEGTTHLYKVIPQLIARIEELENALYPFARVAAAEQGNVAPPQLSHVYLKDCKLAFDVLDPKQAETVKVDDFFSLPAEF